MTLSFRESAVPTIDAQRCNACGRCAQVCGTATLALDQGRVSVAQRSFMGCFACGQCMAICPNAAIRVEGRRFSPNDLVDLPSPRATADQLDALLLARRSIRRFTAQEVDRATVDRILAMTSTAPMGIPPSEVGIVVFHGRDKVHQFAAEAVAWFGKMLRMFHPLMLALMRPMMGKVQAQVMREFVRPLFQGITADWAAGRDHFTYDAPLVMLFHCPASGDPADAHIAATYAMLAAESLGLGTCMLGTPVALERNAAFKAKHGIPKDDKIGLAVIMGYPDARFRRGIRRQLASVRFA